MAQQRYFLKKDPKISILLPDGTPWKNWVLIDHDNGVIAPQNDYLAAALVAISTSGAGGVVEISKEVYDDWLKKKPTALPPRWRDEWAPKQALPSTEVSPRNPSTTSEAPPVPAVVVPETMRPTADDQ